MRKSRSRWLVGSMAGVLLLFACLTRGVSPLSAQTAEEQIYELTEDMELPRLVREVRPEYSGEAEEAGLEGTGVLKVVVRSDGRADNFQVDRGLGMGLDEKAIAAVEQWRFRPAMKDGEPVAIRATIEVSFGKMPSPSNVFPRQ